MVKEKVIILGAGIAGSQTALELAQDYDVHIFTKSDPLASNSALAQGGIAAAVHPDDEPLSHYRDTLIAGHFENNRKAVRLLVEEAPHIIEELHREGFIFDQTSKGKLLFGLEGAHSMPRILHAGGDQTGLLLTRFLHDHFPATVQFHQHEMATSILLDEYGHVAGIRTLTTKDGHCHFYHCDHLIIATGGIGQIFGSTSNDLSITGDGIAMAIQIGARVSDLSAIQFHPTLYFANGHAVGLVSEAVRGQGAVLVDQNDRRLMAEEHPLADLAPRDVVSSVLFRAQNAGCTIFLDISAVTDFETKFPQITAMLDKNQEPFRLTKKIPVQPGAHFLMGGISTNLSGQTSIPDLYAIGEAASTGVHGSNRLASNSLLEAFVFSKRAADQIKRTKVAYKKMAIIPKKTKGLQGTLPEKAVLQEKVRQALGIERSEKTLNDLLCFLATHSFLNCQVTNKDMLERRNMCILAAKMADNALVQLQRVETEMR
ncbi:FAD-dependent oxidoreductase [Listeria ilorinensis]|uniref:FAD-dependent oxidoreductase n=1 Tax=Listeria ilorinensis TaxID=2867439 RepID=UPI001EF4DED9|nr:FAD-dependent oxidoreductase [Listeria ilorinensis]